MSVSCNIPGTIWDKYQQTSFPSNKVVLIFDNHEISAVVHRNLSLLTNKQHWSDLLQIAGWWETPVTSSDTQRNSSWVQQSCWLLLIPFWHLANYTVLRASHFFSLSSSSPIPHQQIMVTQPPLPGQSGSNSSLFAGATSNTGILVTQQEHRHQVIHRDAANGATQHMTQDAHVKSSVTLEAARIRSSMQLDVSICISR